MLLLYFQDLLQISFHLFKSKQSSNPHDATPGARAPVTSTLDLHTSI